MPCPVRSGPRSGTWNVENREVMPFSFSAARRARIEYRPRAAAKLIQKTDQFSCIRYGFSQYGSRIFFVRNINPGQVTGHTIKPDTKRYSSSALLRPSCCPRTAERDRLGGTNFGEYVVALRTTPLHG